MNEPDRTLPQAPDGVSAPGASRRSFLGGPERLALLVYGACLVLVLVLYHFQ